MNKLALQNQTKGKLVCHEIVIQKCIFVFCCTSYYLNNASYVSKDLHIPDILVVILRDFLI